MDMKIDEIEISKEEYPNLYEIGERDIEYLEKYVKSVQKATGATLEMAIENLERDLEHERLCS